jgi:hypothetical protein
VITASSVAILVGVGPLAACPSQEQQQSRGAEGRSGRRQAAAAEEYVTAPAVNCALSMVASRAIHWRSNGIWRKRSAIT